MSYSNENNSNPVFFVSFLRPSSQYDNHSPQTPPTVAFFLFLTTAPNGGFEFLREIRAGWYLHDDFHYVIVDIDWVFLFQAIYRKVLLGHEGSGLWVGNRPKHCKLGLLLLRGQYVKVFEDHNSGNRYLASTYQRNIWNRIAVHGGNENSSARKPCGQRPTNEYVSISIGSVHEYADVHGNVVNNISHVHQSGKKTDFRSKTGMKQRSNFVPEEKSALEMSTVKKNCHFTSPGIRAWEESIENNLSISAIVRLGPLR